jgi:hypothetical protein
MTVGDNLSCNVGDNLSCKFAHLQKHSQHKVPLSEGNKKARQRCILCTDKQKYLLLRVTGKIHLVSISVVCNGACLKIVELNFAQ